MININQSKTFILTCAVVLSTKISVARAQTPVTLTDIPSDFWARTCIVNLANQKIFGGYYEDGTFRPDRPMTRAEFAAVIRRAFPTASKVREAIEFIDVPTNYWGYNAIKEAYQTAFISAYNGSIFNPEIPVTRIQIILALSNGLKLQHTPSLLEKLNNFSDSATIPASAQKPLLAALEKQLVIAYPDVKQLNLNQNATRAEVAGFLCQALANFGKDRQIFANNIGPQFIAQINPIIASPQPTPTITPTINPSASTPAPTNQKIETVEASNISLELSYETIESGSALGNLGKNFRLKVQRSGQIVLEEPIAIPEQSNTTNFGQFVSLKLRDLDGDQEPEIWLDLVQQEQVDCCLYSFIYSYNNTTKKYSRVDKSWENVNYELKDLDNDNIPEIVSRDGRFANIFATGSDSRTPLQIWQYRQGKLADVTSKYNLVIYTNASQLWIEITEKIASQQNAKGLILAYLAQKYLLNQSEDGWALIRQVYQASDRLQFFSELQEFLVKTGYIKATQNQGDRSFDLPIIPANHPIDIDPSIEL